MITKLVVYLDHPDTPATSGRVLRILNDVKYPGPASGSYMDVLMMSPRSGTWGDLDQNLLIAVIRTVATVEKITETPSANIEGV